MYQRRATDGLEEKTDNDPRAQQSEVKTEEGRPAATYPVQNSQPEYPPKPRKIPDLDGNENVNAWELALAGAERPWVKKKLADVAEQNREKRKREEELNKIREEERKEAAITGIPSYLSGRYR